MRAYCVRQRFEWKSQEPHKYTQMMMVLQKQAQMHKENSQRMVRARKKTQGTSHIYETSQRGFEILPIVCHCVSVCVRSCVFSFPFSFSFLRFPGKTRHTAHMHLSTYAYLPFSKLNVCQKLKPTVFVSTFAKTNKRINEAQVQKHQIRQSGAAHLNMMEKL